LLCLRLNFTQLLNVRSELRLLLDDKDYSSFGIFVAHDEDLLKLLQPV